MSDYKITTITNWLISGAYPQTDFDKTVAELGNRLIDCGLCFDMLGIYGTAINPLVLGIVITWTKEKGVRRQDWSHEEMNGPKFVGSVAEASAINKRFVRYRIGANPTFDNNEASQPLIRGGYVEFLAIPLIASHDSSGMLGVATKRREGFTSGEVKAFRKIAAPLARVFEAQTLRENMQVLLATYIGTDASKRVLAGQIRRGDAEIIPAVILFADLVGFTEISNNEKPETTIHILNQFYSTMDKSIGKHGGEILKLIGDGLLAIFPAPDDFTSQQVGATNALLALEEAHQHLTELSISFRASLNLGEIHYGNIGSESRLDFTAIGPAVNLAARILTLASEIGEKFVCTQMVNHLLPEKTVLKGDFELKGFASKQSIFSVKI